MIWMRLYGATLFVHVLGVIALFGGLSLQQRAGSQLRRAETLAGARRCAEVLEISRPMVPAGAVMLLVTGVYLGHALAGGEVVPWIVASAADTLLIGVAAVAFLGPDLRAIQAAVAEGEGTLPTAALTRIRSARTWGVLGAVNGAALGTLWLMVMKPDLVEAVLAAALPALAGAAIGSQLGRPRRARALAGPARGGEESARGTGSLAIRLRLFMSIEAAAFLAAALVHAGLLVGGYEHARARVAEIVIAVALLGGVAWSWLRPDRSRRAALASQGFALAGTAVGLLTIAIGVGPRTAPDLVYHAVIVAVLTAGLLSASHARPVERGAA